MSDHPPLCICHACMQAEITRWRKGCEGANRLSQGFEDRARKAEARAERLAAAAEVFLGRVGPGRIAYRGRGEERIHEVNGVDVQAFRAALAEGRREP